VGGQVVVDSGLKEGIVLVQKVARGVGEGMAVGDCPVAWAEAILVLGHVLQAHG